MNKKIAIVVGLLIVILGGIYFFTKDKKEVTQYEPYTVEAGSMVQIVSATGTVSPQNRLEIKAPVAGRVEKILIKEGQNVKRGEIIAWISSNERAALMDAVQSQGSEEIKKWGELYRPTSVIAPIDGTIILKSVETGQSFTTTDPIFVMADRLTVKGQVDETDIALIKLNQKVQIVLDAYPNHEIKGEVVKLAYDSTLTNNVTTYQVDVLPIDAPEFLRSGMTSTINVEVMNKENVLKIPTTAIITDERGMGVLLAQGDIKVFQNIKIGLEQDGENEVLSGLKAGDVIFSKVTKLKGQESKGSNPFMSGPRRGRK